LSPTIVLDADFLSAFLKIQRLDLVRDFYGAETLRVPAAVYREISLTNLLPLLTALHWVQLATPEPGDDSAVLVPDFVGLGKGEQEAIRLSRQIQGSLLLMNDLKARRIAHQLGVETVDVPAFLLSCKLAGFLSSAEIRKVVEALQEKDRYGFRKEVLARLLS
jgi:predicted nucleic acid-binding protein